MTKRQAECFRPCIQPHRCKIIDQRHTFRTSFIWKVAFHLENVQTGTGFRSKSFYAMPLEALKFWLVIIKDNPNAVSVRLHQKYEKYLGMSEDTVNTNVCFYVNGYDFPNEYKTMNGETNFVSVTIEKENVSDTSFETRKWWVVKCSVSVTETAYLKPRWFQPGDSTNKKAVNSSESGHLGKTYIYSRLSPNKLDKIVLSSRTRLFQNLTDENESSNSKLRSIPKAAMEVVLNYIKTGKVDHVKNLAYLEVYNAAKLVGVDLLSETCSAKLAKQLDIENVLDVMHLSVVHKDDDLQMEALRFIAEHFHGIRETNKWMQFQDKDKFQALRIEKAVTYFEDARNFQPLEKCLQEMTISENE